MANAILDEELFLRVCLLEKDRKEAQENYTKNPFDSDNLTRWGKTLVELSSFVEVEVSKKMIKAAVSKLQEALIMDPRKHEALFSLGNAYSIEAYLLDRDSDGASALACLDKAIQCFQKAVDEDPENEQYLKSLKESTKVPAMFTELEREMTGEPTQTISEPSTSANSSRKKKSNDLVYDICGWIILGVGIMAWLGARIPVPSPIG